MISVDQEQFSITLKMKIVFLLIICVISVNSHKRVKRIVGGVTAAPPPPDDPVIFVRLYSRDARIEGIRNTISGLYSFFGIKYAEAPTGVNRFVRPRYKRLLGDINATQYGSPCPQPDQKNLKNIIGDEDCLLLNVYSPKMPDETTGLPVIIWIHGGGFRFGSAAQYGPNLLTDKNVILVPIQYRLGTLGVLGDGKREFAGNVALFDMAAAVRWVKEYISFFGGNPDNIKIMGHGSGAASAMFLAMSNITNDAISGVIAMSGTAISKYALDEKPVQSVEQIASINNCPAFNETEILVCMRKKRYQEIVDNDSKVQIERLAGRNMVKSFTGFVGVAPNVEEKNDKRGLPGFITTEPNDVIKNRTFKKIPLLTGVTKDETANGIIIKEIETIFNGLDNFLKSLTSIVGLEKLLDINQLTGSLLNVGNNLGLPNLNEYLAIPNNVVEILPKLIETTTDAFFNLPIFSTLQEWNKKAPSYFYSFEYTNGKKYGRSLLEGLPLVGKSINDKLVGHGDELGFLFDINDVFGNPMNATNSKTKQDRQVQNIFTNLIADFANIGNDLIPKSNNLITVSKSKGGQYLKITDKLTIENDFRFCQLSTWGLPIEQFSTTSCKFLTDNLLKLNELPNKILNPSLNLLGNTGLIRLNTNPQPNRQTSGRRPLLGLL